MLTPLTSALIKNKDTISFHTPAHCGGIVSLSDTNLLCLDSTELTFSDNLLNPTGVIADSLCAVSKCYNASATTYVTAGATSAIHTAIRTLRNKTFLILGATHKSVFNALRINKCCAYYSDSFANYEQHLTTYNISVLIVTSPNYFGSTLQLEKISAVCKQKNVSLMVDASHGAHFAFCDKLPVSATEYADWVIHSCHKTMAVPTGGALLHYPKQYTTEVLFALNEVHSSSPSYLTMALMEQAIAYLATNGQSIYCKVLDKVAEFTKKLANGFFVTPTSDKTRLVISSKWQGSSIAYKLESYGIFAEMSSENNVVYIVNPNNYLQLDKLADTLNAMDCTDCPIYTSVPQLASCNITKLQFAEDYTLLPIEQSVGKVCYHEVGIYPPGTALIVSGEIITKQKADVLINLKNLAFGLVNDSIAVVK